MSDEDQMNAATPKPSQPRSTPVPQAAIDRATEDVERLEEVWNLEESADPPVRAELVAEEVALMADFDRVLPLDEEAPSSDK